MKVSMWGQSPLGLAKMAKVEELVEMLEKAMSGVRHFAARRGISPTLSQP